jgi:hypothetical protein
MVGERNSKRTYVKNLKTKLVFFVLLFSKFSFSQTTDFDDLFLNIKVHRDSFIKSIERSTIFKLDTTNKEDKYWWKLRAKTTQQIKLYKYADSIEVVSFYTTKNGMLYKEKDTNCKANNINCCNLKLIIYISDTTQLKELAKSTSIDIQNRIKSKNPNWKNLYESKWYIVVDEKKTIEVMNNYSRDGKRKSYLELVLRICP